MSKTVTITGRVRQQVKDRLAAIAKERDQDEAELVAGFIEASVAAYDYKAAIIRERIAKADARGPFVSDEDADAWLLSLGTENELPIPEGTIYTS